MSKAFSASSVLKKRRYTDTLQELFDVGGSAFKNKTGALLIM
jgi:hypothetical protein